MKSYKIAGRGDLSHGAIHRLASEMCLINKEEPVYA